MISAELVKILACPNCKEDLTLRPKVPSLDCLLCKLRYPIEDDVPVLLIDRAEKIT